MNTPAALMGMIASEAAEESLRDALERVDWKARALAAEAKIAEIEGRRDWRTVFERNWDDRLRPAGEWRTDYFHGEGEPYVPEGHGHWQPATRNARRESRYRAGPWEPVREGLTPEQVREKAVAIMERAEKERQEDAE